jgi:hypothetical protein
MSKAEAVWALRYMGEARGFNEFLDADKEEFHEGLKAILLTTAGIGPVKVTEEYAEEWFSMMKRAFTAIRHGRDWNVVLRQRYEIQLGKLVSCQIPADKIAFSVSIFLSRVGPFIMRCPRKGCVNFFVPHRKQRYCSPRCSSRTRLERHRATRESK